MSDGVVTAFVSPRNIGTCPKKNLEGYKVCFRSSNNERRIFRGTSGVQKIRAALEKKSKYIFIVVHGSPVKYSES